MSAPRQHRSCLKLAHRERTFRQGRYQRQLLPRCLALLLYISQSTAGSISSREKDDLPVTAFPYACVSILTLSAAVHIELVIFCRVPGCPPYSSKSRVSSLSAARFSPAITVSGECVFEIRLHLRYVLVDILTLRDPVALAISSGVHTSYHCSRIPASLKSPASNAPSRFPTIAEKVILFARWSEMTCSICCHRRR